MAIIVIKDLPENIELDRQAMIAISGGARAPGRQTYVGGATLANARVVNYPAGFNFNRMINTRQ